MTARSASCSSGLRELGLADKTNVIVVSDHGFGHGAFGVDVTGELIKAGLKAGPDSDDVVVASSGQTILLHVRERNAERISAVVRFLQRQSWAGVLFTRRRSRPARVRRPKGASPARSRSSSFTWRTPRAGRTSSSPSRGARPAARSACRASITPTRGRPGRSTGTAGNHGSMSPWVVHNTFLAWGPDFKRGVTVRTPASNVDLAPTLLALMNLDKTCRIASTGARCVKLSPTAPTRSRCRSRSARILSKPPDGSYRAAIQVTELERQRYVDKSWRVR